MRIFINEKKGARLWLALPTGLMLNKFTTKLVLKGIRSRKGLENIYISDESLNKMFAEIKRMKKKYPGMEIVDVHTKDGDVVKIKL